MYIAWQGERDRARPSYCFPTTIVPCDKKNWKQATALCSKKKRNRSVRKLFFFSLFGWPCYFLHFLSGSYLAKVKKKKGRPSTHKRCTQCCCCSVEQDVCVKRRRWLPPGAQPIVRGNGAEVGRYSRALPFLQMRFIVFSSYFHDQLADGPDMMRVSY